ncbi:MULTISPECIES: hypothetical protein [unclassified Microcoleus]|uniref:hypothetical protein n=1 Tax=unclassified Microcoleus TaxID=2642155 RepID=UPI001D265866|nr:MULTISPECIES: hypothetical protein [unclassified Microcoleus]MCC3506246.1 hypothetical protein [Microcoleus sp. PH2017_19_SFW_U_A]MCC3523953.1 hypothetical protein [Microcoleus sp. PH2017_20_SFW_D_A]MCC3554963.1 hypothetical protein [Microcoleus sp. PH2017_35_SFW_U_B]MCC3564500.1 hypothetical protein [Microcoleus sp. PH2017_31_RDM_U_A]MCC3577939.1 hypothetical protein [Microcoleus sp. PH2017_32_RDM_D_A]
MTNSSDDKTLAYQRRIEALYANEATANFKKEFWPADPFDGILVDATYLDVQDLVAIHKAAKTLKDQGNEAFVNSLILCKQSPQGEWGAIVRVSPLWIDAHRSRRRKTREAYMESRRKGIRQLWRKSSAREACIILGCGGGASR